MIDVASLLNYSAIVIPTSCTAMSVAVAQGRVGRAALESINIQPSARNEITKAFVLGMALMETGSVLCLALSIMLLFDHTIMAPDLLHSIGRLGMVFALSLSGVAVGIVSAWPAMNACAAIARQPFFSQSIFNMMIITLSLIQTPIIFSVIIAWIISLQAPLVTSQTDSIRLLASGFVMGFGSIGPVIGTARFAGEVIKSIGFNRTAYTKLITFTFISEAIIETPVLFSFIVALLLLLSPVQATDSPARQFVIAAAALCTGIGTLVPSIMSGRVASAACRQIAHNPNNYPLLVKASMFCQILLDTLVIYAAFISLIMFLMVH